VGDQVDIVGIDNIPKHGPVIFSGNHSNQFVDGVVVLTTAQHRYDHNNVT
jgi:glycerol-3-phosphate O-acyltransferase / dihydroxyacetone phosphate acyltransferase